MVAKAALENDRRFVQKHGSEEDASLNHDALYHIEAVLKGFQLPPEPICSKCKRPHSEHTQSSGYLCPGADPKYYEQNNWTP